MSDAVDEKKEQAILQPTRRPLSDERIGKTLKFKILVNAGEGELREVGGYIHTGEYEDGSLGEIFIKMGKAGESEAVFDDCATILSIALQHGVPLEVMLDKLRYRKYMPGGNVVGVEGVRTCTSPLDLATQWLLIKYGRKDS